MTLITVQSQSIGVYEGIESAPKLRIYATKTFEPSTGGTIIGSRLSSADFYKSITCSVAANVVTVPAFTIDSTVDALSNPSDTKYILALYSAAGLFISIVHKNFRIPATPTTTTLGALAAWNQANASPPVAGTYTTSQIDAFNAALALLIAGKVALTGDETVAGVKTFSSSPIIPTPTTANQAANKAYVDGLGGKLAARVATVVAGTLATSFENGDTVDGIVLATGDRILIKNQSDPTENGIRVVAASGAPARAADADSSADLVGAKVVVAEGTSNADREFICTTDAPITLGVTGITFSRVGDPRVGTVTSSATPTPNADLHDLYTVTALAVGATYGAPTGTPVNGQPLMLRIKDNGGTQTLAFNPIYRAIGVTLPTATTASKTIYIGAIYNSADSKWDVLGVGEEA